MLSEGLLILFLGLDDDIFTQNGLLLSAPQPTHRPPITPSLFPSPDSFRLTCPTNSHRNFFFARLSQLVRLITRLYSVFAVWNSAASTVDVRRRIDASFSLVRSLQNSYQAARYCRTQWFSINISHLTRANAPFPLPSCNHQESNETALLVIFIRRVILRNSRRGGRI